MKHVTHWYGFTEPDIDGLGKRLESELGLTFQPRHSAYLGNYLLDRSGRFSQCALYFNRDPLWLPDSDPVDEEYFEAEAADCELLLLLDASVDVIAEASRAILDQFPTARHLKSMEYEAD